jgi:hypothetical protein
VFQEAKSPHPYELRARSAKTLLQRLYRDASSLVVEELQLAQAELAERSAVAVAAVRSSMLAVACALLCLACVAAALIAALAAAVGFLPAALIVGLLFALATFAFGVLARRNLSRVTAPALSRLSALLPADTNASLAERRARVEWTRRQVAQTYTALEQKTDMVAPLRDTALGIGALGVTLSAIARDGNTGPTPR